MYASAEDLRKRLGASVFDEIYASSEPDGDEWSGDLESAEAEIDGVLALRYRLPLQQRRTLQLLKDWTLTLAEERAYARAAGGSFSDKVKERAAQVRKYLEDIRTGQFLLSGESENDYGVFTLHKSDPEVFGRGNMEGF